VIGQPDFTSAAFQTTQNGLNLPVGTVFDSSGNLWVVDGANSRVLEYAAALPTTTRTMTTTTSSQTSTSSTTTATTTKASTTITSQTTTAGEGGVPQFSFLLGIAVVVTIAIVVSYLIARRAASPKGP